jgi:hypothetical protein
MSPVMSPRWMRGAAYRRPGYRGADLRVSDAERAEVADSLSRHHGDGRLDQVTFNERLDRAMNATTQADLAGLLADLPPTGPPAPAPRTPPGRPRHRLLFLALVVVIAAAAGPALARFLDVPGRPYFPWLLIGFVAVIWLSHRDRRNRR